MSNKRVEWKICKSSRVEKVQVGWGKSKNAIRVDSFIWHLRVSKTFLNKTVSCKFLHCTVEGNSCRERKKNGLI